MNYKFSKRVWHFQIIYRSILMYVVLVLASMAILPVWVLVITTILLYVGIYFAVHEIGHNLNERKYPLFARFIPVATPIWGGTRIFAITHYSHHMYFGTTKDPWLQYYNNSPIKSLFFNFIEPEINLYNYIKMRGIDKELSLNIGFNLLLLGTSIYFFTVYFLIYILISRLCHMTIIFLFNYRTHRSTFSHKADFGFYEREKDTKYILPVLQFIWGKALINGYMYHNRHHCLRQWSKHPMTYPDLIDTGSYSSVVDNYQWPSANIINLD